MSMAAKNNMEQIPKGAKLWGQSNLIGWSKVKGHGGGYNPRGIAYLEFKVGKLPEQAPH